MTLTLISAGTKLSSFAVNDNLKERIYLIFTYEKWKRPKNPDDVHGSCVRNSGLACGATRRPIQKCCGWRGYISQACGAKV